MRTRLGIALIIITCAGAVQAQLNSFLYSDNTFINVNPSFAGSNGNVRVQGFAGINAAGLRAETRSFYNAADMYLPSIKSGLALTAYHGNSNYGMFKTNSYSLSFAKHISLRDAKIKFVPSVQVGFRQGRIAYMFFQGQSASLPEYSYFSEHIIGALGGLFNIRNFYFGASFYNFQPITRREQYSRLLDRYNIHASYNLRAADRVLLNFSGNVVVNAYSYTSLNLVLNALLLNHFLIGGGILTRQSYFLNGGYRGRCFTVRLGYDQSISQLIPYQAAGWTAIASFNLRKKELRKEVLNFEAW